MQYLLTQAELDELKGNKDKVLEDRIQAAFEQLEKDIRPCVRKLPYSDILGLEIDMMSFARAMSKVKGTIRGETPAQKEAVRKTGG